MSPNPLVAFKRDFNTLLEKKELALPSSVSQEAFKNAAVVAVQDNPKILTCDQASVFKSIRTLAAAGLVPDGREAALVPFKTKQDGNWIDKCQAMPMVFGLIKMVRRSGTVKDIRAHIVYEKELAQDRFTYVVGDEEKLEHSPILFGDRGEPMAAYAIAVLTDGAIVREFMSAEDIEKVRQSSAAQRIYKKGQPPKISEEPIGIWKDWWDQMWKKTVIRRLCKRLDMSSEDMRRLMVEEDAADIQMRDITPKKGGFATRAAQQQEPDGGDQEPSAPLDGEIMTEEADEGDDAHWTASLDLSDAFPGDDAFTEGAKAFEAGTSFEDCPYKSDPEKAVNWCGGWDQARKFKEEADAENA